MFEVEEEAGAGAARAADAEATSKLEVTKVALLSFILISLMDE